MFWFRFELGVMGPPPIFIFLSLFFDFAHEKSRRPFWSSVPKDYPALSKAFPANFQTTYTILPSLKPSYLIFVMSGL